ARAAPPARGSPSREKPRAETGGRGRGGGGARRAAAATAMVARRGGGRRAPGRSGRVRVGAVAQAVARGDPRAAVLRRERRRSQVLARRQADRVRVGPRG